MGKILNALKTANGEIPDLVLQCLDETPREAPSARSADARQFSGRRTVATAVVEPIFEKTGVVRLPSAMRVTSAPSHPKKSGRKSLNRCPSRASAKCARIPAFESFRFKSPIRGHCSRRGGKTAALQSNTASSVPGFSIRFRDPLSP